MNCRSNRYSIRLADENDSDGIRAVFESGGFSGGIAIQYLRGKDPVKSLYQDGEKAVIPVIVDNEKDIIVGVGACIIRRAFINGESKKVGYLTALKLLPEYQKRISLIPQAYNFLYENTKNDVDLYYTTILVDNIAAQKLLEKHHRNMPEYSFIGEYIVYCYRTGQKRNQMKVDRGNVDGIDNFYDNNLFKSDLACVNKTLFGLSENNFFTLRKNNKVVAACAVWNQQEYKQYLLSGYQGKYKLISKLPTKLFGYPPFPKNHQFINYASIALLCFDDSIDEIEEKQFIEKVLEQVDNYDMVFCGLFENDKLNPILSSIKHVKYKSRLYEVNWDDSSTSLTTKRRISIDVGLL